MDILDSSLEQLFVVLALLNVVALQGNEGIVGEPKAGSSEVMDDRVKLYHKKTEIGLGDMWTVSCDGEKAGQQ